MGIAVRSSWALAGLLLLLLALAGLVLMPLVMARQRERFSTAPRAAGVSFVGAAELAAQPGLRAYFDALTPSDRVARGGCGDCMAAYLAAVVTPADGAPAVVATALVRADAAEADRLCAVRAPRLLAVPWRVALLRDVPSAENGWPHTHGDVVCLPVAAYAAWPRARRVETLLHERVHVLQRVAPLAAAELVEHSWGCAVVMNAASAPADLRRLARANPDLDGRWYACPGADAHKGCDAFVVQLYDATAPRDLAASRPWRVCPRSWRGRPAAAGASEHPYERMAYAVAAYVTSGRTEDARVAEWCAK